MFKMIVAPAALCAAAFLTFASPAAAAPLAVNAAALSAESLSDVTLVQNRNRNRNNAQNANRNRGNANRNNNRKDRRNAAAVGAAVGILGGLLLSQQQPAYAEPAPAPGFYRDDYHREVFHRCRHRRGFDPHTMTYVNRFGEVRRCR